MSKFITAMSLLGLISINSVAATFVVQPSTKSISVKDSHFNIVTRIAEGFSSTNPGLLNIRHDHDTTAVTVDLADGVYELEVGEFEGRNMSTALFRVTSGQVTSLKNSDDGIGSYRIQVIP